MLRWIRLVSIALLIATLPAEAQQLAGHSLLMPDGLKWTEPAVLPGAKMALVQGDPTKEGLFVYRFKFPASYKIPPHFHKGG